MSASSVPISSSRIVANRSHPCSQPSEPLAKTVDGTLARMEIWVDGAKKYLHFDSPSLATSINLTAGSDQITVCAVNTDGTLWIRPSQCLYPDLAFPAQCPRPSPPGARPAINCHDWMIRVGRERDISL